MGHFPPVLKGMQPRRHLGQPFSSPRSANGIARRCRHAGRRRTISAEHYPCEVARLVGALEALPWIWEHDHMDDEDKRDLTDLMMRRAALYVDAFRRQPLWMQRNNMDVAFSALMLQEMVLLLEDGPWP